MVFAAAWVPLQKRMVKSWSGSWVHGHGALGAGCRFWRLPPSWWFRNDWSEVAEAMQSEEDSSLSWCTECVQSTTQQMRNVKSNNIRTFSRLRKLHRERRRSACILHHDPFDEFSFRWRRHFPNIMTVTRMTSNWNLKKIVRKWNNLKQEWLLAF